MKPSSATKSFQALSIGVGGLLMIVAEAAAAAAPVHPRLNRSQSTSAPTEQVASWAESEASSLDLAACFLKPNRIGLASVRNLLRE